ncbi:Protein SRT-23 [Aphelenchoides avenae]|nr:Protein SRT-23 [Aphelenchus avenae]
MDIFLFKRNDYERLYNCSLYNVTDVPLEKRQSILLGTFFTTCFIVFELLYIPCLVAISRRMEQSCYKLMFYIGLIDVACLWIPGFLTG